MDFGRRDYNDFLRRGKFNEDDRAEVDSDEPVFLIRGKDPIAPRLLMMYATELMNSGSNMTTINSVAQHADRFRKWQKDHGTKGADILRDDPDAVNKKLRITEILNKLELGDCSDDKLIELQDLVEEVYGPKSLCVLLPSDLEPADTPLGFRCKASRGVDFQKAVVAYASNGKSIVLMKRNLGL